MRFVLTCEMWVPSRLENVFRFFEDPRNLGRITPPNLRFVVTTPGDIEMHKGAVIDYTIRWLGLPMKWRTLIGDYAPPDFFVDEQLRGPYRAWIHRHDFKATGGGTLISDRVEYELPLGILGRLAHAVVVGRQLRGIFAYRQQVIARIMGSPRVRFNKPEIRPLGTS